MNTKKIQTIPMLLSRCNKKYGKKPAMRLINGNMLSYTDMMWDISRTSQKLRELGVSKGSKVALFVENTPQALETFLAILNMGAVAIPLRCDLSANHVSEILTAEKPEAIFVGADTASLVSQSMKISVLDIADNTVICDYGRRAASFFSAIAESDPAVMVFQENDCGVLRRRVYTHKEMSREAVVIKRPVKVSPMPFDTLVDYSRSFIMPILNGVCICCRDILHSLSAMQIRTQAR